MAVWDSVKLVPNNLFGDVAMTYGETPFNFLVGLAFLAVISLYFLVSDRFK